MQDHNIKPERITKPIQLLAAWLIGLIVVNATFIGSAKLITHPTWGAALLLIAAVANVPVFIIALFLLQTKFRPELQADDFYSAHLKDERELKKNLIEKQKEEKAKEEEEKVNKIIEASKIEDEEKKKTEIEKVISDFKIKELVRKYKSEHIFIDHIKTGNAFPFDHLSTSASSLLRSLENDNIINSTSPLERISLTPLGEKVLEEIRRLKREDMEIGKFLDSI